MQTHVANEQDAIWQSLSARAQRLVGVSLPPREAVGTSAFGDVLRRIQEQNPAFFQELMDALTGSDTEMPVEQEATAAHSREQARRRLFAPLFRPDGLRTGLRRLDMRRTVNYVALGVVAVAFMWSVGGGRSSPPPTLTPSGGSPQQASPPVSTPVPVPPAVHSGPIASSILPPASAADPTGPEGFLPPPASTGFLPPPVPVPGGYTPGMTATGQPAGGPVVFQAPPSASAGIGSTVVFRSAGAGESEAGAGGRTESIAFQAEPARQTAPAASVPGVPPADTAAALPTGPGSPPTAPAFRLGQLLQARLVLAVSVSPSWGPVPVLAELTDEAHRGNVLWGQARIARDGLIEMSFTQVLTEKGAQRTFHGVAFDPVGGRPGVSGQIQTVLPNALQTAMSSTLQAASDYFKARVNQQQVTITNGFITITQPGLPSFWDVYSKSLAQAMTPTTQNVGPTLVARLPQGAPISVMVIGQ